jgi:signal transduction histidine kinase
VQSLVTPRRGRRPAGQDTAHALVLDGDERSARNTAKLLEKADAPWLVDWAPRLEHALGCLAAESVDVVIATIRQPDGEALSWLQHLRERAPDVPVVTLTEFASHTFSPTALGAGAQDCLARAKLEPRELDRALRYGIARHRVRAQYQHELWSASILHADFLSIIRNSADAILILNEAGLVEFINPAAEWMFGVEADSAVGRPCPFGRSLDGTFEIEVPDREGRRRQAEVRIVDTSWRGREATMAMVRDITDRRVLELQLGQAQKLESVGRLAAGIAHEINTPTQFITDNVKYLGGVLERFEPALCASRALVEAAGNGGVDEATLEAAREAIEAARVEDASEEVPEAIEDSLEGLGQIARIVGAMKVFAHPGSDEKTAVDLRQAVESTVAVAHNEWRDFANVTVEVEPELPAVPAVPGDLNQVLLNLIVNASQAIADRADRDGLGTIAITARQQGDWVEMNVTDDGIGIGDEDRPHIFDPFFTTKEVGRGTGQGLSISRTIVVERHGGMLDVTSTPGEGSTFTVRLPLTLGAEQPDAA